MSFKKKKKRRKEEEEFSRVVDITVVGDFLRVSV